MKLYPWFKKAAFKFDPELVHDLSIQCLERAIPFWKHSFSTSPNRKLSLDDGHMRWPSPIGIAAGFDKNARAIESLSHIGFGSVEVGTVTVKPQEGNPKPRIWRMEAEKSLRNAMGFPNLGMEEVFSNIEKNKYRNILGVNIGKNKDTSIENTGLEYAKLYTKFAKVSDYIVINISSPNTKGLRAFQSPKALKDICVKMSEARKECPKPLYLKIAPDLEKEDVFDIVNLCKEFKFSGIIATNTTVDHPFSTGGASGGILKKKASDIRSWCCQAAKEEKSLSVIGVGGIDSFEEILNFWKMGGSFVQIYTGFIYQGPNLVNKLHQEILNYLEKNYIDSVQDLFNHYHNKS